MFDTERSFAGIAHELVKWQAKGWRPILFGGFLRDVMILGPKHWPRDIDVVVGLQTTEELERELVGAHPHRNRFGGLRCEIEKWNCDIWPLRMTWGFRQIPLEPTPTNLPRTTFLNVEAIAAELAADGEIGQIYDGGFFEAASTRILDINFEENPYPLLAAVRAILTAQNLNFSIATRLSAYILRVAETEKSLQPFTDVQLSHYGQVRLSRQDLAHVLRALEAALRLDEPWRARSTRPEQFELWA